MPGSLNVACTSHVASGGTGGTVQPGAHGESEPSRVSSQALNCSGAKVTLPAPR